MKTPWVGDEKNIFSGEKASASLIEMQPYTIRFISFFETTGNAQAKRCGTYALFFRFLHL